MCPSANILAEVRGIPNREVGHLINAAEADVYPLQPDLMIFHSYGAEADYERFLSEIRRRTYMDVVLQTDLITDYDPDATLWQPGGFAWSVPALSDMVPGDKEFRNYIYLPEASDRWGQLVRRCEGYGENTWKSTVVGGLEGCSVTAPTQTRKATG